MPPVGIPGLGSVGGYLHRQTIAASSSRRQHNSNSAVFYACIYCPHVRKNSLDLPRRRISSHVYINLACRQLRFGAGFPGQQTVPDAPADEICLVPGILQPLQRLHASFHPVFSPGFGHLPCLRIVFDAHIIPHLQAQVCLTRPAMVSLKK